MPELPEAEYMVRRLEEYAPRAVIVKGPATGRVKRYYRRAKNVLIELDSGCTLRVQLGMTGHIYWIEDARKLPRFTREVFELKRGRAIVFEDARRFGRIAVLEREELEQALSVYGPEPLDPLFNWRDLKRIGGGLAQPVKPFLMDQTRIAGLGNIWAAESLHAARVHPARPVRSLTDGDWRAVHGAIRRVLSKAIKAAFDVTDGPGDFPEADLQRVAVYGRAGENCRRCRSVIERVEMGGRGTFYCGGCQH